MRRLWDFLIDVPTVSRCAPGVRDVEPLDDKAYHGALEVNVGPIRLPLPRHDHHRGAGSRGMARAHAS